MGVFASQLDVVNIAVEQSGRRPVPMTTDFGVLGVRRALSSIEQDALRPPAQGKVPLP